MDVLALLCLLNISIANVSVRATALMQSFQEYNVSHTINRLRFGPDYPTAANQLDGEHRIIPDVFGMYQYYVQVRRVEHTETTLECLTTANA